jgi:hypothetical protein
VLFSLIGMLPNQGFKCAHSVEKHVERMSVSCCHRAPPYMWGYEVMQVLRCVCLFRGLPEIPLIPLFAA